MLGTFLLATSGSSLLHNPWYYFGFFSLLIHLVRILWVFLRFSLVACFVERERHFTAFKYQSCYGFLLSYTIFAYFYALPFVVIKIRSKGCSRWVLCRQGDLSLVLASVFLLVSFKPLLVLIGPECLISIRFCGYGRCYGSRSYLACDKLQQDFLCCYFWMIYFFLQ